MPFNGIGRRLKEIFQAREMNEEFFLNLEDTLIEGDLGVSVAEEIVTALRELARKRKIRSQDEILAELSALIGAYIRTANPALEAGRLNLLLVLGVNGVGKTTTIAKMARYYREKLGVKKILLAAGDTFRAGAIEQLKLWGERLDIPVVAQENGADPGAVLYDAIASARARGCELLIADTAGRLHNREALMKELMKIDKVIRSRIEDGIYRRILVLDATTGQNAYQQAEVFHKAVGVDSIVLSKFDSTAKGGMAVPICRDLGLSFSFFGLGEKPDDLEPFDREKYLRSLLGSE
jgi:fused signal recognition particle receptor